ncbi:hypothetical protein [Metabacillus litoralis]|uniref:hypothetical protein n=1 Tax=Metabacillus litoralis TaxID=152268 RepID=UPI002042489D|nr:hypothetical protein [Metabacillus litoralis]MCM3161708.1 hypothetical protein [Metabacillus litoralis]
MKFIDSIFFLFRQPKIVLIPIFLDVLLTLFVTTGALWGFTIFDSIEFTIGNPIQPFQPTGTYPIWIPEISDLKVPAGFIHPTLDYNVVLSLIITAAFFVIRSFLMGAYLGSLKSALTEEKAIIFHEGRYYFKRFFLLHILFAIIMLVVIILGSFIGPFVIVLFLLTIPYILTPYVVVLEDCDITEALGESKNLVQQHFWFLIRFALLLMFSTFLLTLSLQTLPESVIYITVLIVYPFIGSAAILTVMGRLYEKDEDEAKKEFNDKIKLPFLLACYFVLFSLPFLGANLAKGEYLMFIDFSEKQTFEGLSYQSANGYILDDTFPTYEWRNDEKIKIKLSLPSLENEPEKISGTGTVGIVTTTNGGEHEIKKVDFIYTLHKSIINDTIYYRNSQQESISLLNWESDIPQPAVTMMVNNEGNDVFFYLSEFNQPQDGAFGFQQTETYFDVNETGQIFLPIRNDTIMYSYPYYWFSTEWTKEKVSAFLDSKNNYSAYHLNDPGFQIASLIQEGSYQTIIRLAPNLTEQNIQHNLDEWKTRWEGFFEDQYGNLTLSEYLTYASKSATYEGFESHAKTEDGKEYYERNISFPTAQLKVRYRVNEDGQFEELYIIEEE